MSANKTDSGKPRLGLISSVFLIGLARVLTFGAKKPEYGPHNWRKGLAYSRVYDALQRHLTAWNDGEDLDACEPSCPPNCRSHSGLSHLDHAACELMFLREFVARRPDLDDRYRPPEPEETQAEVNRRLGTEGGK